jgi:HAD superfamily phosphatase (TIGR01668 family)
VRFLLAPSLMVDGVWEVDLDALRAEGIMGLILDLDNTLVDWNQMYVRPEVRRWLRSARAGGMRVSLVSNAMRGRRVKALAKELGLLPVTLACKPLPRAFRRAMKVMGTDPRSTCAVGDQVFTDLLGANWLGLKTVLVQPLSPHESPHTRIIRLIERPMRRRWSRSRRGEQASTSDRG